MRCHDASPPGTSLPSLIWIGVKMAWENRALVRMHPFRTRFARGLA